MCLKIIFERHERRCLENPIKLIGTGTNAGITETHTHTKKKIARTSIKQ